MSISPFKSDNRLRSHQKSHQETSKSKLDNQRWTLFDALTITAGMAGLIGLVSGAFIRFSLTHSSNARFLSPLQTFPALSNWTPNPSELEANSSELGPEPNSKLGPESNLEISPELNLDPLAASDDDPRRRSASSDYPASFDEFANRSSSASVQSPRDPLETLSSGPLLRESGRLGAGGVEAIIPELEDPAFEPYFDPDAFDADAEVERFYQ